MWRFSFCSSFFCFSVLDIPLYGWNIIQNVEINMRNTFDYAFSWHSVNKSTNPMKQWCVGWEACNASFRTMESVSRWMSQFMPFGLNFNTKWCTSPWIEYSRQIACDNWKCELYFVYRLSLPINVIVSWKGRCFLVLSELPLIFHDTFDFHFNWMTDSRCAPPYNINKCNNNDERQMYAVSCCVFTLQLHEMPNRELCTAYTVLSK